MMCRNCGTKNQIPGLPYCLPVLNELRRIGEFDQEEAFLYVHLLVNDGWEIREVGMPANTSGRLATGFVAEALGLNPANPVLSLMDDETRLKIPGSLPIAAWDKRRVSMVIGSW